MNHPNRLWNVFKTICCVLLSFAMLVPEGVSVLAEEAVNLTQYVTRVTTYENDGSTWVPTDSFTNGDPIYIKIDFAIPDSQADHYTYTYALPDGITFSQDMSWPIRNSENEEVGMATYADGVVTVVFDKGFIQDDNGFIGNLEIEGQISENNDATHNITFPGSSTTISVKPKSVQPDISVSKKGAVLSGNKIEYTVAVTSQNGTGGQTVTIIDSFTKAERLTLSDIQDVSVSLVQADGSTSIVDSSSYRVMLYPGSSGENMIIMGLPALSAGQSLVITYFVQAALNSSTMPGMADNLVQATAGSLSSSATASTTVMPPMIQKDGEVNLQSQTIAWSFTINTAGEDIAGAVIDDTLPDGMKLVSGTDIKVYDTEGDLLQEAQAFPFTLTSSLAEPFVVKFTTDFGTLKSGDSSTNTATLSWEDQTWNSSKTVQIGDYGWTIKKQLGSVSVNGDEMTCDWNVSSYPDWNLNTPFVLKDAAADLTGADSTVYEDSQTFDVEQTKAAILNSLRAEVSTSQGVVEMDAADLNVEIVFYNAQGQAVSAGSASSFELHISGSPQDVLRYLSFSCQTTADLSNVPSKTNVTASNTAETKGESSTASATYSKPGELNKGLVTSKGVQSGDVSVSYEGTKGVLTYELDIPVTQAKTFVVTDTFSGALSPQNITYAVEVSQGSLESEIDGQEVSSFCQTVTSLSNGKTLLTIGVDGAGILQLTEMPVTLVIQYDIPLSEDTYWNDTMHTEKTYSNTVSVNGESKESTVSVSRPLPEASKSAVRTSGSAASAVQEVEYSLIINPAGSKLGDGGSLSVTDVLGPLNGVNAQLELSTVKLSYYDTASRSATDAVPAEDWTFQYDSQTDTMDLVVPDGTPLILTYTYKLENNRSGSGDLTNSVSVEGKSAASSTISVDSVEAGGTVLRFEFFVYKTDAENYTLHLQGAQFTLSEYDASSKSWKTLDAGLTTNGDGMFSFVGPDAQNEFAPGTLFELTETKAPEGYALSDKAILFCFGTGSQSDQEAIDSLKANGVPDDLADQAQVFDEDGGNLYIPNERLPLNVKKVWKDENGNVIDGTDAGVDAVTVRLYCSTSEDGADLRAADADAIVLDEANDWSGQWTNLPETDDDGNALWYFVKEEVPNGWKVSVDGQGSKAYGDIVIMNTKDVAVTIAATGGDASAMKMVAAGVLLATVGIVLFQNKRKNKR